MSNVRSIRDAQATARRASEWLVLLETGEATDDDRARFAAWRQEPGNQAAFDELKQTWARLHVLGERVRREGIAEADPDVVVRYRGESASGARRGKRWAWSAAAAGLVAVVGGMLLYSFESSTLYRTNVGQQTTITLPDRSTVQLNTDTELRVAYTDTSRNIEMLRGEAYFDVTHDPERPFVVKAGHGAIRAVGTGFVVQMKSDELVAVTVTEGIVEVTRDPETERHPAASAASADGRTAPTLREGQRVEYDRQVGVPAVVPPEELNRKLAWRQGMLIFDGQALNEVIREVGRYTDTRLIIADRELEHLRIGGAFRAGDTDALLEILEKGFDVAVERNGPRTVYLSAAP